MSSINLMADYLLKAGLIDKSQVICHLSSIHYTRGQNEKKRVRTRPRTQVGTLGKSLVSGSPQVVGR